MAYFFMATRSVIVFVAFVSVGLVCVTKIIHFHSFPSLYKGEKRGLDSDNDFTW